MSKEEKVYIKNSSIPAYGKGLFANIHIKKGSIIAEFKGKLLSPGESPTDNRSNVYFNDEYIIQCHPKNPASFANDAINFNRERRHMIKALNSTEPFYRMHPNSIVNSEIKINDNLHRAFLIATNDIQPNSEIFCHYSFPYWFKKELTEVGFLYEDEIEKNGFPTDIYKYPAFQSYLTHFYPDMIKFEVRQFDQTSVDIIIHIKGDSFVIINLKDYASKISKVNIDDL